ncbi:MAG: hypothetical protein IJO76_05745 [Clostridia bacterium]|nr:hypothetical protein [Clostridia bacterium]
MNIYNCKHYFPNLLVISIALIPMAIGIYYLFNYQNPFAKEPAKVVRDGIVFLGIGVIFFTIYVASFVDNYINVFIPGKNGQLEYVEGLVTDLSPSDFREHGADEFSVNNVRFIISNNPLSPGYNRTAANGGVISSNGMSVKIGYVEYKNHLYIMCINVLDDQTIRQGTKTGDGSPVP